MDKKRKLVSAVLIAVGSLLIAACLVLIWWDHYKSDKADEAAKQELAKVENAIAKREPESSISNDSRVAFIGEQSKQMPVVEIDGYEYIGYLDMPSLDVKLPVMNTYSEKNLDIAPCRFYGSLQTDDLVIAGHNFRGGFNKLSNIQKGDKLSFTNMDGDVFVYVVKDTEMLDPDQVTDMVQSSWDLSLYTCNYTATQRFTVRCSLIEQSQSQDKNNGSSAGK